MFRRVGLATAAALTVCALGACSDNADRLQTHELTGSAMGTAYSVKIVTAPGQQELDSLGQRLEATLAAIESSMSTYIADSELSRFNAVRGGDWFEVSAELCGVVAGALAVSAATGGAFDITVGPLVNLWGFGADGPVGAPPDAELVALLTDRVGHTALHADCSVPALRKDLPGLYVDLSAYAKGYGVDRLAALLDRHGVGNYLAEVGGELRLRGHNAAGEDWAIAIEAPVRQGRAIHAIMRLSDAAVATSGDYRNFFEHEGKMYSHTIDPRTGYPVAHGAASVTVVAGSAAYADAMATALLVLGPDDGLELAEREGIAAVFLVRDDDGFVERASSRFLSEVTVR